MSIEKIITAIKSRNPEELERLSKSSNMRTRRAVARNIHSNRITINTLAEDPTKNVNYHARKNKYYTGDLSPLEGVEKDAISKCILCEINEDIVVCGDCNKPRYVKNT